MAANCLIKNAAKYGKVIRSNKDFKILHNLVKIMPKLYQCESCMVHSHRS